MRGSLYRRTLSDGRRSRWHAVIDVPSPDGRRRQRTRTFETRRQAQAWLATMATQPDLSPAGPTMVEHLHTWLAGRLALRPSTTASYRAVIDRHLLPRVGHLHVSEVTPTVVRSMFADLTEDTTLSASTLASIRAVLSRSLAAARRDGLISTDPVAGVELPPPPPVERRVWTADQCRAFLAHTAEDDLACLWRVALVTGMRRGELLGLRWSDLDPQAGTLRVHRSRVPVGAHVVEGPPKSRAGSRTVHLDVATVRGLHDRRARAHPAQWSEGYVFADPTGVPLSPAWVSRLFQELAAVAGLPAIRFHDLRHTSATLGLAAGEAMKLVSARLGHADIGVTANIYTHVPDRLAAGAAANLAQLLDRPTDQDTVEGGPELRLLPGGAA